MTLIISYRSNKNTVVYSDSWFFQSWMVVEWKKVLYNSNFVLCLSWDIVIWKLMFEFIDNRKLYWFKSLMDITDIYKQYTEYLSEHKMLIKWDKRVSSCVILINKYWQYLLDLSWYIEESTNWFLVCWIYRALPIYAFIKDWPEEWLEKLTSSSVQVSKPIVKYEFQHSILHTPKTTNIFE